MPTLADSVKLLKIQDKVFNSPEWWSTTHKLKREAKRNNAINEVAKRARFRASYRVFTVDEQPSIDRFISTNQSKLDLDKYKLNAPWGNMFNKFKTIITFVDK